MTRIPALLGALALALLLLPAAAFAEVYQVDLIVFLQGGADGESPLPELTVDTSRALEPSDLGGLHKAGIRILPQNAGGFGGIARAFERSGHRYETIEQLSWIQDDPPDARGPSLHITGGGSVETPNGVVRALDGTVSLHGGFYLHVDTDLVWTERAADGSVVSWHLDENRRLRLNETHYLDNARFGVITRVTRKDG